MWSHPPSGPPTRLTRPIVSPSPYLVPTAWATTAQHVVAVADAALVHACSRARAQQEHSSSASSVSFFTAPPGLSQRRWKNTTRLGPTCGVWEESSKRSTSAQRECRYPNQRRPLTRHAIILPRRYRLHRTKDPGLYSTTIYLSGRGGCGRPQRAGLSRGAPTTITYKRRPHTHPRQPPQTYRKHLSCAR